MKNYYIFILSLFLYQISPAQNLVIDSPVTLHGQLAIEDGTIVNSHNNPVQLKGMSLFWSQWQAQFYNFETIKMLKEHWGINVIRAAMAVEHGGYLENPEHEKEKIFGVIDAAIELGLYVIIDWHDHHAEDHRVEAREFFSEVARLYGDHPNIIYEPYNEPLNVSWTEVLKPYHEDIIAAIRHHDPDNIIVLGTPTWSQRLDLAAEDPIEGDNLAYTLHFYAGTHKEELRQVAEEAMAKGIALFVTEFGTTNADGDGPVDVKETQKWMEFMDKNNLSWCNWSIADKDESSASLLPGTSPKQVNNDLQITQSGKLIKAAILKK